MKVCPENLKRGLSLLAMVGALSGISFAAGINATASFTDTQLNATTYEYFVTLNNTGSTNIGTFWFAWIPPAGFLSATPTNVLSPASWSFSLTNGGAAIQWVTGTAPLSAGQSLAGFDFDSTETPAQMLGTVPSGPGTGDPVTTSFAYIGVPEGDPGVEFTVTQASGAPEPGTIFLIIAGLCAAMALRGVAGFTEPRR